MAEYIKKQTSQVNRGFFSYGDHLAIVTDKSCKKILQNPLVKGEERPWSLQIWIAWPLGVTEADSLGTSKGFKSNLQLST
jgi:hypothetical protein